MDYTQGLIELDRLIIEAWFMSLHVGHAETTNRLWLAHKEVLKTVNLVTEQTAQRPEEE